MDKLIISVAVTGSVGTKEQNPSIPITPEEIAESAMACWRAGASIVHVHARDAAGVVTADNRIYSETVSRIREKGCGIVINLTTGGGAGKVAQERRLDVIDLRPEIASFDAGSMNFGNRVFLNPPDLLEQMAAKMLEYGVKPEIECFDVSQVYNARRLIDRGMIKEPFWYQFVLGLPGGAPAEAKQLVHLSECLPPNSMWSVAGIGRFQLPINIMAIAMGGHVRTGMEDNLYYRKGDLATGNAQLVERIVRISREMGREIASSDDVREALKLRGE